MGFEKLHQYLGEIYQDDCCHQQLAAGDGAASFDAVRKAFAEAMTWLHGKKRFSAAMLKQPAVKKLMAATNDVLQKAVNKSIRHEMPEVMRQSLQKDVFYFSGMKTYTQMKEASGLLLDEKGNIRPLPAFQQEVKKIDEAYNDNYLRAERNFAVGSAQSASRWAKYEDEKERYDLKYMTDNGPNVRDSHRAMEGTVLPVDDPFWNRYMPPNDFNCHCFTLQVRKGEYPVSDSEEAISNGEAATTKIGKDGTNKAEIFRFNSGKEMKVFPPGHPYTSGDCGKLAAVWHGLSARQKMNLGNEADKCRALKVMDELSKSLESKQVKSYRNGGEIHTYPDLINEAASDYKQVWESADFFAAKGDKMVILPKAKHKEDPIYKSIYQALEGTKYYGKCPDLLRNGQFYEHEGFTTPDPKNALKNMLNRGVKQSSKIIIEKCGVTERYLKNNIYARIKQGQDISEVWEKDGKKLKLVFKKTEAQ